MLLVLLLLPLHTTTARVTFIIRVEYSLEDKAGFSVGIKGRSALRLVLVATSSFDKVFKPKHRFWSEAEARFTVRRTRTGENTTGENTTLYGNPGAGTVQCIWNELIESCFDLDLYFIRQGLLSCENISKIHRCITDCIVLALEALSSTDNFLYHRHTDTCENDTSRLSFHLPILLNSKY